MTPPGPELARRIAENIRRIYKRFYDDKGWTPAQIGELTEEQAMFLLGADPAVTHKVKSPKKLFFGQLAIRGLCVRCNVLRYLADKCCRVCGDDLKTFTVEEKEARWAERLEQRKRKAAEEKAAIRPAKHAKRTTPGKSGFRRPDPSTPKG